MKARITNRELLDTNGFAKEVLNSDAFAGARLFFFESTDGDQQEMLMFALKAPVDVRMLSDMVHVLVDTVDFYECWKGGNPPSETDLAALSPTE